MNLTKHRTQSGPSWRLTINSWLRISALKLCCNCRRTKSPIILKAGQRLHRQAIIFSLRLEPEQEVWASGVPYYRSRDAREAETDIKNTLYKSISSGTSGTIFQAIGLALWQAIRTRYGFRKDSSWNVTGTGINARRQLPGEKIIG